MKGLLNELTYILDYWEKFVFNPQTNCFYGQVNAHNIADEEAPMGSVMYARILWAFSAAYKETNNIRHIQMAEHAYTGLTMLFTDTVNGGVYWTVSPSGTPLENKKQIYALAFAIYGLTEYYSVTHYQKALDEAIALYRLIEKYSFDPVQGGYIEAFNCNWTPAKDLRLSEKDDNGSKTLNTHLHIMEAYMNLYRVWPNKLLSSAIRHLINLFDRYFIDKNSGHLVLFFNEAWQPRSRNISYGHEIETSWLLCEAAMVLKDPALIEYTASVASVLVNAALEGFDAVGALNYEYIADASYLVQEKHWWVQAEAAVGLLNAWQITGESRYKELFEHNWSFIIQKIIDRQNGEWHWGVNADGTVMAGEDKAGIWKCPYHNTRAVLEIMKRTGIAAVPY
jgi:mannobiose 2-epimerase